MANPESNLRKFQAKCWFMLILLIITSCSFRKDALETEVILVSQTADFNNITYTVRIVGSGLCDYIGVEVTLEMPVTADSKGFPGTTFTISHDIGRVSAQSKKTREFTDFVDGRKIDQDNIKIEISDVETFENCKFFNL